MSITNTIYNENPIESDFDSKIPIGHDVQNTHITFYSMSVCEFRNRL